MSQGPPDLRKMWDSIPAGNSGDLRSIWDSIPEEPKQSGFSRIFGQDRDADRLIASGIGEGILSMGVAGGNLLKGFTEAARPLASTLQRFRDEQPTFAPPPPPEPPTMPKVVVERRGTAPTAVSDGAGGTWAKPEGYGGMWTEPAIDPNQVVENNEFARKKFREFVGPPANLGEAIGEMGVRMGAEVVPYAMSGPLVGLGITATKAADPENSLTGYLRYLAEQSGVPRMAPIRAGGPDGRTLTPEQEAFLRSAPEGEADPGSSRGRRLASALEPVVESLPGRMVGDAALDLATMGTLKGIGAAYRGARAATDFSGDVAGAFRELSPTDLASRDALSEVEGQRMMPPPRYRRPLDPMSQEAKAMHRGRELIARDEVVTPPADPLAGITPPADPRLVTPGTPEQPLIARPAGFRWPRTPDEPPVPEIPVQGTLHPREKGVEDPWLEQRASPPVQGPETPLLDAETSAFQRAPAGEPPSPSTAAVTPEQLRLREALTRPGRLRGQEEILREQERLRTLAGEPAPAGRVVLPNEPTPSSLVLPGQQPPASAEIVPASSFRPRSSQEPVGLQGPARAAEAAPVEEPERIVAAAVRGPDGRTGSGGMHVAAMVDAFGENERLWPRDVEDLFLTSTGRYVGRDEARRISAAVGQASDRDAPVFAEEIDFGDTFDVEPEFLPAADPRPAPVTPPSAAAPAPTDLRSMWDEIPAEPEAGGGIRGETGGVVREVLRTLGGMAAGGAGDLAIGDDASPLEGMLVGGFGANARSLAGRLRGPRGARSVSAGADDALEAEFAALERPKRTEGDELYLNAKLGAMKASAKYPSFTPRATREMEGFQGEARKLAQKITDPKVALFIPLEDLGGLYAQATSDARRSIILDEMQEAAQRAMASGSEFLAERAQWVFKKIGELEAGGIADPERGAAAREVVRTLGGAAAGGAGDLAVGDDASPLEGMLLGAGAANARVLARRLKGMGEVGAVGDIGGLKDPARTVDGRLMSLRALPQAEPDLFELRRWVRQGHALPRERAELRSDLEAGALRWLPEDDARELVRILDEADRPEGGAVSPQEEQDRGRFASRQAEASRDVLEPLIPDVAAEAERRHPVGSESFAAFMVGAFDHARDMDPLPPKSAAASAYLDGFKWSAGGREVTPAGPTLVKEEARPLRGKDTLDDAGRLERARAQGFDVDTPLYHGSTATIEGAMRPGDQPHSAGIFLTNKPDIAADIYARGMAAPNEEGVRAALLGMSTDEIRAIAKREGLDQHLFYADAETPEGYADALLSSVAFDDMEGVGQAFDRLAEALRVPARLPAEGANVTPVYARLRNPMEVDARGEGFDAPTQARWIAEAKAKGHDGLVIRNYHDGGHGGLGSFTSAGKQDVTVVFDPKNVRSKYARFDPENAGGSDLTGAATPEVVRTIAGAGAGAAIDREDPTRGALLGVAAANAPGIARGLRSMDQIGAVGDLGRLKGDGSPLLRRHAAITQEAQSYGRHGYGVRAPDDVADRFTKEVHEAYVGEDGKHAIDALIERRFGRSVERKQVPARGWWEGDANPNTDFEFPNDLPDEAVSYAAAMHGLLEGQDGAAWYRRVPRGTKGAIPGHVLTGPDMAPLPAEVVERIRQVVNSDDRFAPLRGAHEREGHLLFRNFSGLRDKEYAGLLDEVRDLIDMPDGTPYAIDRAVGHFTGELLNGPRAYLRVIGRDADGLRQARQLLLDKVGPVYQRWATRLGQDPDAVQRRIAERVDALDHLLREVEEPPLPGNTTGERTVQQAAEAVAAQFADRFTPIPKDTPLDQRVKTLVGRFSALADQFVEGRRIPQEMAKDWYKGATGNQRSVLSTVQPERREETKHVLATFIHSILSNGQEVPLETTAGAQVAERFFRTGKLSQLEEGAEYFRTPIRRLRGPEQKPVVVQQKGFRGLRGEGFEGEAIPIGTRAITHEDNLKRLENLIATVGEENAVEWLQQSRTLANGRVSHNATELFGPKIGQYALDKLGVPSEGSTIDLWIARLYHVLNGQPQPMKRGGELDDSVTPEMRRVMQAVLKAYADERGANPSSAQALGWYVIKDLFGQAGAKEKAGAYGTLSSAAADFVTQPGAPRTKRVYQQGHAKEGDDVAGKPLPGWGKDSKLRGVAKREGWEIPRDEQGQTLYSGVDIPAALKSESGRVVAGAAAGGAVDASTGEDAFPGMGMLAGAAIAAGAGRALRPASKAADPAYLQNPAVQNVLKTVAAGQETPLLSRLTAAVGETPEALRRLYTRVVDQAAPLKRFGREVGGGRELQNQVARAAGWKGAATERLETEFKKVLTAASGHEKGTVSLAKAERALELEANGMPEKGVDLDDARETIRELGAVPEVRAAVDALRSYYRALLTYKLENGALTQEAYDAITAKGEYYVPFVRDFAAEKPPTAGGGRLTNRGTGVRKMTDEKATAATVDPFEQAILDTYEAHRTVSKQRVTNVVASIVEADPQAAAPFLRKIAKPEDAKHGRVVQANVEGKRQTYEVLDEELYDAWAAFDPYTGNIFTKALAPFKRSLQFTVTLLPDFAIANAIRDNVQSGIQYAAPVREGAIGAGLGAGVGALGDSDPVEGALQGAGIGAGLGMMTPHLARTLSAMRDITGLAGGNKDVYREWLREGGGGFGQYVRDPKSARKMLAQLQKEGVAPSDFINPKSWAHALQAIGHVVEQAPRLARYKHAKGAGADVAEAVAQSRDISLDFARSGKDTKGVAAVTAFFNAKVQGWDKLARMLKQPKTYATGAAMITAPSIALWSINKDNPEYWARPQWERNMFWLVPKAGGGFFRIPKPFEIGFIFASVPERILDWQYQKDPETLKFALADMLRTTTEGTMPIPTALEPLIENKANFDFFRNRPVVSMGMERLPEEMQYDNRTSSVAVGAGKLTGMSPQKIDNLLQGWFGGVGREALLATSKLARATGLDTRPAPTEGKAPILGRFVTRDDQTSDAEMAIRRRFEEAEKVRNGALALVKRGDEEGAREYLRKNREVFLSYYELKPVNDALAKVSDLRRTVADNPEWTGQQKRQAIAQINTRLVQVLMQPQ